MSWKDSAYRLKSELVGNQGLPIRLGLVAIEMVHELVGGYLADRTALDATKVFLEAVPEENNQKRFLFRELFREMRDNLNKESPAEVGLWLLNFPPHGKIDIIKAIRRYLGLGPKEAKEAVDAVPCLLEVPRTINQEEVARELKRLGCSVELR